MKFLVDAQLPARLATHLSKAGHDVLHTSKAGHDVLHTSKMMPNGNRSTDAEIAACADDDDRAVVTKDRDFRDSHLLTRTPKRLLLVETGNITNNELIALFEHNIDELAKAPDASPFVEMGLDRLVLHGER